MKLYAIRNTTDRRQWMQLDRQWTTELTLLCLTNNEEALKKFLLPHEAGTIVQFNLTEVKNNTAKVNSAPSPRIKRTRKKET
jgi:hypothetical protein